jgi:hypothetical protein
MFFLLAWKMIDAKEESFFFFFIPIFGIVLSTD